MVRSLITLRRNSAVETIVLHPEVIVLPSHQSGIRAHAKTPRSVRLWRTTSGRSTRRAGLESDSASEFTPLRVSSFTARSSGSWFWPLGGWVEAAQSRPLVPTSHGGERPQ